MATFIISHQPCAPVVKENKFQYIRIISFGFQLMMML